MLGAIEQKIKDMKRNNCQKSQGTNCYNANLSNIYLPTVEELNAETIYLNGSSVKISNLKDEFEYSINNPAPRFQPSISYKKEDISLLTKESQASMNQLILSYRKNGAWDFSKASSYDLAQIFPNGVVDISRADENLLNACKSLFLL